MKIMTIMAIGVVKFPRYGYKIKYIFDEKSTFFFVKNNHLILAFSFDDINSGAHFLLLIFFANFYF